MNNQEIDLRTKWTRINMFKHIRANWIHPGLSASAACQHQMFNHPSTSGHGTHPNGPNPPTVRWPACRHGPHGTLEVPNWNPTFKIGVRRWKRKNAFQPLHSVQTVGFFIFKVRTLHVYHYRLKFHCFQPLFDLWSQAKWNNLEVKTCKKSIIIIIIISIIIIIITTSHNNDDNDNDNDNNNNNSGWKCWEPSCMEGQLTKTALRGASKSDQSLKTPHWAGNFSQWLAGRPSPRKPKCRWMKDFNKGYSFHWLKKSPNSGASTNFLATCQSVLPRHVKWLWTVWNVHLVTCQLPVLRCFHVLPCAFQLSVGHTTASCARMTFPLLKRTPLARPPSTKTSSTCAFRITLQPHTHKWHHVTLAHVDHANVFVLISLKYGRNCFGSYHSSSKASAKHLLSMYFIFMICWMKKTFIKNKIHQIWHALDVIPVIHVYRAPTWMFLNTTDQGIHQSFIATFGEIQARVLLIEISHHICLANRKMKNTRKKSHSKMIQISWKFKIIFRHQSRRGSIIEVGAPYDGKPWSKNANMSIQFLMKGSVT